MFPCRGKAASTQVNELVSKMGSTPYGMIWIDIEDNPSTGCSWNIGTSASNCQFLGDLISAIRGHGKTVGIYSSYYMW